jgi:hypothetical protein
MVRYRGQNKCLLPGKVKELGFGIFGYEELCLMVRSEVGHQMG